MSDPISDMLSRIRNAQMVKQKTTNLPYSKIKLDIAEILIKEGFLESVNKLGRKTTRTLELVLKYEENGSPRISEIKRISKPSQRVYAPYKELHPLQGGLGRMILSTPLGLLTDREAKKKKVGGEILMEIW
jgi:small subunit ribosomal protein S8